MFKEFKELGQLAGLIGQLPKIRAAMGSLQMKLPQLTAEGSAGGGMVTVKVNGKLEILTCKIGDDAWKLNDREMLEDLVRGAANQALEKARQMIADETAKMAGDLGLPASGVNLPMP